MLRSLVSLPRSGTGVSKFIHCVSSYRLHSRMPASSIQTAGESSEQIESTPVICDGNDDLKSRIFRLRLPKRSAIDVLRKWMQEGNHISDSELRNISKELRERRRYKHALEISEWMLTHEEFQLSDSDHAVRIDMMNKVFGVHPAERYFEGLPPASKNSETYTALLHCYAGAGLVEQAEELYEKIKNSNSTFTAVSYNEMMTMYMSIGQIEKISTVMEDLKRKGIVPDLFTYNLLVSSYAANLDMEEVERVLEEMKGGSRSSAGCVRYAELVKIYITATGLSSPSANSIVDVNVKAIHRGGSTIYDLLILLYSSLGNGVKVIQIWDFLKKSKQEVTCRSYASALSSYVVLGDRKEAGEVIDRWKLLVPPDLVDSMSSRLLDSFYRLGVKNEAEALLSLLSEKGLCTQ